MAGPTRGATRILIRELGAVLDPLVDLEGHKPLLTIEGIAPDGLLIEHKVTIKPQPLNAAAVRAKLLEILASFEQEWGVWTERLELSWSVAPAPGLWVSDGSFRASH